MSPALLLSFLVAGLIALIPVWRLHVAGWPPRTLLTAWLVYAAWILVSVRFPGPVRFLLPILVLAYVAPFVAGPERLSRMMNRQRAERPGVVIDVTPRPSVGPPEPPRRVEGEVLDDDARTGNPETGQPRSRRPRTRH